MLWKSPASRWTKPFLTEYLEPGEEVRAAAAAFSGILSHPLILSGPYMLGSALWDLALTDRRIVAVQRPVLPIFRRDRKVLSFPLNRASVSMNSFWGIQAILYVDAPDKRHRFKIVWPSDVFGFAKACDNLTGGTKE